MHNIQITRVLKVIMYKEKGGGMFIHIYQDQLVLDNRMFHLILAFHL